MLKWSNRTRIHKGTCRKKQIIPKCSRHRISFSNHHLSTVLNQFFDRYVPFSYIFRGFGLVFYCATCFLDFVGKNFLSFQLDLIFSGVTSSCMAGFMYPFKDFTRIVFLPYFFSCYDKSLPPTPGLWKFPSLSHFFTFFLIYCFATSVLLKTKVHVLYQKSITRPTFHIENLGFLLGIFGLKGGN